MIQVHSTDDGFSLSFKGHVVLKHSPDFPCIQVGQGTGQYALECGNFHIKEQLYEKIALQEFEIQEQQQQKVVIRLGKEKHSVVTAEVRENRLEICFTVSNPELNRCWLTLCASETEHIYGCGEQFSVLDLKGKSVPLWVQEKGVGRGKDADPIIAAGDMQETDRGDWHTTYYPQPTFVSSDNYFCHAESSSYAIFDFSAPDVHQLHFWQIPEKIIIAKEDSAPAVLQSLTEYLGRQPELPEWVYDGVWLGIQGGTDAVERKLQTTLEAGVKVVAIWAQDWEGKRVTAFGKQLFWDWKYDATLYPDLPEYIRNSNQRGIKFLGYINSFLAIEGELYKEASQKGYLVKKENGEEYHVVATTFPAALLDLSNAEAVAWMKMVIRNNMIGIGLSGWMADYSEYLPTDAALTSGESAELYHNKYPAVWAKLNLEALTEAGKLGEVVFFARSGYTGTSRYATLLWAGDQLVDWSLGDGLATVITASISSGFSGIGFNHCDTGGFTTLGPFKRSKEMFMRWTEMAAFSPIIRTHEGNRPDDNWQFDSDQETLDHFAAMSHLHACLKPYMLEAVKEYTASGLPLMRHPYIHYEYDEVLHTLQYQYLFGRDLMVAPVYESGKTSWKVYLPADRWGFLWNEEEYGQGWHTVEAPSGKPPVFYRLESSFAELFEDIGKGP